MMKSSKIWNPVSLVILPWCHHGPSYSSCSREACRAEDSFADIQHMMSLGYHSQLSSSRSVEEVVQPTLSYIGKSLMLHFNKNNVGRWTGMIFIPRSHNIYCLSFHLKHEGMDYTVDNFKSSRMIGVTNMVVEKISNIHVCIKKILSKCRDMIRLTCEYFQSPTPQLASQV